MIDKKRAQELAAKLTPVFNIMSQVEFDGRKNGAPRVEFTWQDTSSFTPSENVIRISCKQILYYYSVETEQEFVACAKYLFGHECQHVHSTSDKPYMVGAKRGIHRILEYISRKEESFVRRFRNDNDYEAFAKTELPKLGISISIRYLAETVNGILNCLEDGRIERIRANQNPEFAKLRRVFNGIEWDNHSASGWPTELTPDMKVMVLINQILYLSLVQLYQKGFVANFFDTDLFDAVTDFKPFIGYGIMSGTCRGMAQNAEKICDALAPYIYDAAKTDAEKLNSALKQLARLLQESGLSELIQTGLNEQDEDKDEGSANTTFGKSDLVLEVTEEEFKQLMENTSNDGEEGIKMMVKIKGENLEGASDNASSSTSSESNSDGEENDDSSKGSGKTQVPEKDAKGKEKEKDSSDDGSGSSGSIENEASDAEASDNTSFSKDKNETPSDNPSKDQDDANSNKPLDGQTSFDDSDFEDGGNNEEGETNSENDDIAPDKGNERRTSGDRETDSEQPNSENNATAEKGGDPPKEGTLNMDKVGNADTEVDIEEEMKKAAETVNALAEQMLDRIDTFNSISEYRSPSEVPDRNEPVLEKDVKDLLDGQHFKEYKRAYKLDQKLPPVLDARGRSMRKKNERYFRSQKTPNVTRLTSGKVDPSKIYNLAMKETSIFRKDGKDKNTKDHVGYILIDRSGSMEGQKTQMVAQAAAVIEEGFKGILPIKIVAFDWDSNICHEVIKGYDEVTKNNCCWNYAVHGRSGYGNEDGYDIQIATRELMKRQEHKKLLLVLSDGAPGNRGLVKRAVDDARKKGIKVVGIYFEQGMISPYSIQVFSEMYTKDFICCPVNEIDKHLEKIFMQWARS